MSSEERLRIRRERMALEFRALVNHQSERCERARLSSQADRDHFTDRRSSCENSEALRTSVDERFLALSPDREGASEVSPPGPLIKAREVLPNYGRVG